jgi:purine-binding chemotaxis protein CheW
MTQEHLFASFMLDKTAGLEIALRAENVTEATPITGSIQALPASIDFLEGIMHLRNDVIPVINLKKRLGLTKHSYDAGAMVAVVTVHPMVRDRDHNAQAVCPGIVRQPVDVHPGGRL